MNIEKLTDYMLTAANEHYPTLVRLMIECLTIIPFQTPPVGASGIKIVRQFWIKVLRDKEELERARVECWMYLDSHSASTNTEVPEFCALRAVICVLDEEAPSEDLEEGVDFFIHMLRGTLPEEDDNGFSLKLCTIVENFST